jgi:hypothetical protein
LIQSQPSHTENKAPYTITSLDFTQHFIFFTRLAIQATVPRKAVHPSRLHARSNRHSKATSPNSQSYSYPQCQRSEARGRTTEVSDDFRSYLRPVSVFSTWNCFNKKRSFAAGASQRQVCLGLSKISPALVEPMF